MFFSLKTKSNLKRCCLCLSLNWMRWMIDDSLPLPKPMMCETQSFPHLTHYHEAAAHCHCHQLEHCLPATCWPSQQSHRHSTCWLDFMFFSASSCLATNPPRCDTYVVLHYTNLNLSKLHFTSVSHPLSAIGSVTLFSSLAPFGLAFLGFFCKAPVLSMSASHCKLPPALYN